MELELKNIKAKRPLCHRGEDESKENRKIKRNVNCCI